MIEVETYDIKRMLMLLDASQEALDAAAVDEMRRERGKAMRSVTDQERAETVRSFVPEMAAKYDIEI